MRWIAPTSGDFFIRGAVAGLDHSPTTTGFYVVLNSNNYLFSATIDSYNTPLFFHRALTASAEETLDFAVDFGQNGSYLGDSTGIQFKVTQVQ